MVAFHPPKAPNIKHHWGPASWLHVRENKEAHARLGWRLGAAADNHDEDFLAAKVTLQMQITVVSVIQRGKAFVLERETLQEGVFTSESSCVCPSAS